MRGLVFRLALGSSFSDLLNFHGDVALTVAFFQTHKLRTMSTASRFKAGSKRGAMSRVAEGLRAESVLLSRIESRQRGSVVQRVCVTQREDLIVSHLQHELASVRQEVSRERAGLGVIFYAPRMPPSPRSGGDRESFRGNSLKKTDFAHFSDV